MRPKVIMHAQTSLDGRKTRFDDTGIYYAVAARFNEDMALVGSETMYTAAAEYPPETEKRLRKAPSRPGRQAHAVRRPTAAGGLATCTCSGTRSTAGTSSYWFRLPPPNPILNTCARATTISSSPERTA